MCCNLQGSKKMKKTVTIILILAAFLLGWFSQSWRSDESAKVAVEKETKPSYWVAPMDASYRRDQPGKSPMGMDLVPVYSDDNSSEGGVTISSSVVNNLGVKISTVKERQLSQQVNTVGYVKANENSIVHVQTYTEGWVKKLYVKRDGQKVKKGEALFDFYSPALVSAQQEYLLALKNSDQSIVQAQKSKLLSLGLNEGQINTLRDKNKASQNVTYYAPEAGFVANLQVREGVYLQPSSAVMTIEDLAKIWIIADVFDSQVHWIAQGDNATATLSFLNGKTLVGNVDYIYPRLDALTHAARVRLEFDNPGLSIKPNMYANVVITGKPLPKALTIDQSALIQTGEGNRVIVVLPDGSYQARAVAVGIESDGYFIVLSGLKAGEKVVKSAQFLIDSESNLETSLQRMVGSVVEVEESAPDEPKPKMSHNHHQMKKMDMRKMSGHNMAGHNMQAMDH
jgi:membrane fusion protein, copper/silver efflux system